MFRRGVFVAFEGVEGVGKSTQVALLGGWLGKRGRPFVVAREPGGTEAGEAVRSVVLERRDLELSPETELLLMLAARAAFVEDVVRPALARGDAVVADRFALSTFAYQGHGRGLDLEEVRRLNRFATGGLEPDLYVVLDLPAAEGLARQRVMGKAGDRIEREGRAFLDRVAEGYRSLAAEDERVVLVDAVGSEDEVHGRVLAALASAFPETFAGSEG